MLVFCTGWVYTQYEKEKAGCVNSLNINESEETGLCLHLLQEVKHICNNLIRHSNLLYFFKLI